MISKSSSHIHIDQFNYDLPEERIAKFPAEPRHSSKLLIFNGEISEDRYINLPEYLPQNTVLFLNNTKVIEARLLFRKPTGGIIEVFCLEHDPRYSDVTTAMAQQLEVYWNCQIGGAKKWKEGEITLEYEINDRSFKLIAQKVASENGVFVIHFKWNQPQATFAEVLHAAGNVPLPPYLNREAQENDKKTYQTVYAKHNGSVAAPTAGLHFTEELFKNLDAIGVDRSYLTLHVGAGTFKPVKDEIVENHVMHAEFLEVEKSFIHNYRSSIDRKRVAVGTTALRTLESLYWMGVKLNDNDSIAPENLTIDQWEAYSLPQTISLSDAFDALIDWMDKHHLNQLYSKTQIMIKPGYKIRTVDGILTNFHQPKSTLLLLIHAFIGDAWRDVYRYAMENDFKFLSYGDGSLLWNCKK